MYQRKCPEETLNSQKSACFCGGPVDLNIEMMILNGGNLLILRLMFWDQ
jgi:hypothetical protein